MELITAAIGTIAGFFGALAAHFIAHDAYSSAPKYARRLIEWGTKALPASDQARYREEWLADLNERGGVISKFRHAIECCICARKLAAICGEGHAVGADRIDLDDAKGAFFLLVLRHQVRKQGELKSDDFRNLLAKVERELGPVNVQALYGFAKRVVDTQGGNIASISSIEATASSIDGEQMVAIEKMLQM